MNKLPLAAPHGEPCHNHSPSSFQRHLTLLNFAPPPHASDIIAFATDYRNVAHWSECPTEARLHHVTGAAPPR
jgi:hypothetical protein